MPKSSLTIKDVRDVPVFVYLMKDPRDESVRYVGKSDNPAGRFAQHLSASATIKMRTWVLQLKLDGLRPVLEIIERVMPGDDAAAREAQWISTFEKGGADLVNTFGTSSKAIPYDSYWSAETYEPLYALEPENKNLDRYRPRRDEMLRKRAWVKSAAVSDARNSLECAESELGQLAHTVRFLNDFPVLYSGDGLGMVATPTPEVAAAIASIQEALVTIEDALAVIADEDECDDDVDELEACAQ